MLMTQWENWPGSLGVEDSEQLLCNASQWRYWGGGGGDCAMNPEHLFSVQEFQEQSKPALRL